MTTSAQDSLLHLQERVRHFSEARRWGQFHSIKNLCMAIGGEVGELLAEVQWLTDTEIQQSMSDGNDLRGRIADEMADVLIYLVRLADVADIDLMSAALAKVAANEKRYPLDKSRGTAAKYTDL